MIEGQCLCGAVRFRHDAPQRLVICNCSACRRYGAIWAHGEVPDITIVETGTAIRYARADGDGDLRFVSCATCGVITHWEAVDPANRRRAVNAALCDPNTLTDLPVRHFDGADTWTFLD